MKKQTQIQEQNPIQQQIKLLSKKYKCLNKENIRIIHQFCQYELQRTTKVLCILEQHKNPISVIQNLIKYPEKSQQLLLSYQLKYNKLYGQKIQFQKKQLDQNQTKIQIFHLGFDFFQNMPDDCVISVIMYLDPYSTVSFSKTSKKMNYLVNSDIKTQYFKLLCTKIFKKQSIKLPFLSRFNQLKDYVLAHPLEFRPNSRNAINNNVRNFIWKMDFNSLVIQNNYFKSFGSYENLFKFCPRIHFNGYYICRDKYVRIGQKDQKNPVAPINIIYYYRYIRFVEDGSVIYHIRNKKMKTDEIMKYLSIQVLEGENTKNTLKGQFVQHKNKVWMKSIQSNQIFSYDFEIQNNEGKIFNELKVKKYTLQLIGDTQQVYQVLHVDNPIKDPISFNYVFNSQIASENSNIIRSAGL